VLVKRLPRFQGPRYAAFMAAYEELLPLVRATLAAADAATAPPAEAAPLPATTAPLPATPPPVPHGGSNDAAD
jgi:hypothetical protein